MEVRQAVDDEVVLMSDEDLILELEEILCEVPQDFFDEHNFNPFAHWKEDGKFLETLRGNLEHAVEKIIECKFKVPIELAHNTI